MAARAGWVLGSNSDGEIIKPAAALYPHQWSWDTAFVALCSAEVDPSIARDNLVSLFKGQWRNGMVPHIVFDPAAEGYFPGPDRWACKELTTEAPGHPLTSGICQPPLHAIAAARVVERARRRPEEALATAQWLPVIYPKLLAWHRFLARERVDKSTGLVGIFHGWESGMDNSPRWDAPYSRVRVLATLPAYKRRDLAHVGNAEERPTREEYDRYLWLVEEAKQACYDQTTLARSCSFHVGDVFFTALFAAANDHLADLAELLGADEVGELRRDANGAREAVFAQVDPATGLAADVDLRTGERLWTGTIAGFAPLIAGQLPPPWRQQLVEALVGPQWAGHPDLRWPLPPSTSPCSASFRPRTYWRGPIWPVMTWLLSWALKRAGERQAAENLRQAGLSQLRDSTFAEYYDPFTGGPLGSPRHSWTAAVALDWLTSDEGGA
jgi:hypothetical protein